MSEKELHELNDDETQKITGGYIYKHLNPLTIFRYEVIDDKSGETIGRYTNLKEAQKMVGGKRQSSQLLKWWQYHKLKKYSKK